MPTESELRALLQGEPGRTRTLDAERIIRAARARRRPKRIAAGALGGLAALALVVPVAVGLGSLRPMSASDGGGAAAPAESAEDMTTLSDSASRSDDPYPGCRLPSWDGDAVPSGVELLVTQPARDAPLVLTLVNDSTVELRGELAGAPILAVSDGDAPLGWSAGAATPASGQDARVVLPPGARLAFEVPLEVVACSGEPVMGEVGVEAGLAIVLDDGATVVANSRRTPVVVDPAQ